MESIKVIDRKLKGKDFTVLEYMNYQVERMKRVGRERTSETYQQALSSFRRFRNGIDLHLEMLDAYVIERYENFLRANHLSRNTSSFYMRILRSIYNKAVADGAKQIG